MDRKERRACSEVSDATSGSSRCGRGKKKSEQLRKGGVYLGENSLEKGKKLFAGVRKEDGKKGRARTTERERPGRREIATSGLQKRFGRGEKLQERKKLMRRGENGVQTVNL